jgi:hypothetical protein
MKDVEYKDDKPKRDFEKRKERLNTEELAEFIHSFYDPESETFPKSPESVCTMVGKKFGERAEMVARKMVERMAPQQQDPQIAELARIKQLSGMQGQEVDEGMLDRLKGLVNKIKELPGIQKYIGIAQDKKDQLAKALQNSSSGKDLAVNIKQAMGGQTEGFGDIFKGSIAASAGGALMAGGADLLMKAYIQMGKPDLTQMSGDQTGGMLFLSSLVLLGALALFGGGHEVKKGLEAESATPELESIRRLAGM